ncbi:MAG: HNH endonuclease signature motif containing protein, partial [Acidimicrobiales bacterium]
QAATHARIKRDRTVKFWTEHDGTHCLLAKGTAEDIGAMKKRIFKQGDAWFSAAYKAGRREPVEAYRFDALQQLISRHTAAGETDEAQPAVVPPKRELVFHIDWATAKRGHTLSGETCEIAGVGPVPVEVALDFAADPFIKAVIRDGTDVRTVVHYGRSVPAELRTALEARGLQCAVPGCSNDAHLEIDHGNPSGSLEFRLRRNIPAPVDHAKGGPLALWNTQYLCPHHHRLKTAGQLHIDLPPPHQQPEPPPAGGDPEPMPPDPHQLE